MSATNAYGTPQEIDGLHATASATSANLVQASALVLLTDAGKEYFSRIQILDVALQQVKWNFEGQLLLTAVQPQGVNVTISQGLYTLGIAPASGTFTVYDGNGNVIRSSVNMYDLSPYMTADDAGGLPFSSGALDSNAKLVNYSSARLNQVIQAGITSGSALLIAETSALSGGAGRSYYVHQFGSAKVTVKRLIDNSTLVTTTQNYDRWTLVPAPSGAVRIDSQRYSSTETYSYPKGPLPPPFFRITIVSTGTQEVWKK